MFSALKPATLPEINAPAAHLIDIKDVWFLATNSVNRELVQIVIEEVGCEIEKERIIWVKPRSDFDVLFHVAKIYR